MAERYWEKVDRSGEHWMWTAASVTNSGYGLIREGGTGTPYRLAHRVAWELAFGPIPPGLHVCHRCDIKLCQRPEHLFLGTQAENNADRDAKGRTRAGRGERHRNAKLTDAQVREIRALYAEGGVLQRELGARFGVGQDVVSLIVRRRIWRHIT